MSYQIKKNLNILYDKFKQMSFVSKVSLYLSLFIITFSFFLQTLVVFKILKINYNLVLAEYICIILFNIPFFIFVYQFLMNINHKERRLIKEIVKKNIYLEHATRILRHDMHSGINTYIPRGISSLNRRLPKDIIKKYKLENCLKLINEGLEHSQSVYKGIYEFTNLVRDGVDLKKDKVDLKKSLKNYLKRTAYADQIIIDDIGLVEANESLICTAIDNLIRNGLKYNDSATKIIKVRMIDEETLAIEDNGRGMSQEDFLRNSKPYYRNLEQKEVGTGLGISISIAILKEHGFEVWCEKLDKGTSVRIKIK